jgi:KDO2-lipid IV(A) lauroyltransferase
MARSRSRVTDYAVYLAVRLVVCVVQALSWDLALKLAEALARLAYRVDRRHRQVALDNLRYAFPDLDDAGRDRLVRATYRHFMTMIVEMIRLPRVLRHSNLYDYVRHDQPGDLEKLLRLARGPRPQLVLTGHIGNWEMLAYVTGLIGVQAPIITRRLDNPYLHDYLGRFRAHTGMRQLDKATDYAEILAILARGGGLGMAGDQDAGARGLFVDFLGRPASTFKSIALLSLEYGAPIAVLGMARVGQPMRYILYFEDLILPEEYADRPDAARAITQRYTNALERLVRRHPEQYFWLHRRWKHQPAAKKARRTAA